MNTSDLTGPALDWAVAKCWYGDEYDLSIPSFDDGLIFAPSTNWLHGGPIIEREKITVECHGEEWLAFKLGVDYYAEGSPDEFPCGPTPLIAAMRCFVASRLGDTIDIPEELQ